MSLVELTDQLGKAFDACLENILTDPQQKEENANDNDSYLVTLKSSFLEIENQIREIRLKALSSKELSAAKSNTLLQKDIDIKKAAIAKYVTKLEEWEKELPILRENSIKAAAVRTDGTDFDSDIPLPTTDTNDTKDVPDDDEDEDIEFEEV